MKVKSIDGYFNGDLTIRQLMNDGFQYPEQLSNGYYVFRTDFSDLPNTDLICEGYYNKRLQSMYFRVHVEVQR